MAPIRKSGTCMDALRSTLPSIRRKAERPADLVAAADVAVLAQARAVEVLVLPVLREEPDRLQPAEEEPVAEVRVPLVSVVAVAGLQSPGQAVLPFRAWRS